MHTATATATPLQQSILIPDDTQQRAVASLRERLVARGATVTDVAGEGTSDFIPFAQKEGGVDAVFLAVIRDYREVGAWR